MFTCVEEIENLMHSMNQQKIVITVREENENEYKLPDLPEGDA